MDGAYLYILRCVDGSLYVGTTRKDLEARVAEHNSGALGGYTSYRKPVALVFAEHFGKVVDAIAAERQIKRWSRAKKEEIDTGRLAIDTDICAAASSIFKTGRRILRDGCFAPSSG